MNASDYLNFISGKKVSRKVEQAYLKAKDCFFGGDQIGAYKYLYLVLKEHEANHEELPSMIEKLLAAVLLRDAQMGFAASRVD